ncbi:MAG: hypothetical protein A3A28_05415 [Candidatus Sungbacteria bacterium RIFCSPLOWO2_01_FULL_47_32]|uniref:DUF190 domain-containing protein n=1 Tax=Candidatus Sungbacteria bacterium RIFCSPHIGHO2_01_FULL_47_32 TaxID=1802264 RepID=A0A1G2K407_9BACT|nr:MAG: hypothetical protein A2633_05355 [Candidatus Sungbacteria bacterium RIFCSPHIGHO2_01_FULL_47_32]OGZ99166.1 MAG: hypothetical protein A3D57_05410 [Candidatus Sungbacteria bacterium RIFCSPHIGHO2_02_FULL_46_12]OHA06041.1 MAG: hypothetical protein A3A28_05415 [Candidatus Sungbacteria bacterium RIFCSPLOWO2_01_FULL_47_32]
MKGKKEVRKKRNQNKWGNLKSGRNYVLKDLGRPAVFFIPSYKLKGRVDSRAIQDGLHSFLVRNFGAFTSTLVPYFGHWKNDGAELIYDESCMYEVSFLGKERIPPLLEKLAEVAESIGEDCIYFKAGQYSCSVWPKKKTAGEKGHRT